MHQLRWCAGFAIDQKTLTFKMNSCSNMSLGDDRGLNQQQYKLLLAMCRKQTGLDLKADPATTDWEKK